MAYRDTSTLRPKTTRRIDPTNSRKPVVKTTVKAGKKVKEVKETEETKVIRAITIPKMDIGTITFFLDGLTPYIQNDFSKRQLDEIAEERSKGGKQAGRAKVNPPQIAFLEIMEKVHFIKRPKKKVKSIPNDEFFSDPDGYLEEAFDGSIIGIPIAQFMKSIKTCGWDSFKLSKTIIMGAIKIIAEVGNYVTLTHGPVTYRRGRGQKNQAFHIFYQPVFSNPWSVELVIEHDRTVMQAEDVLSLFNHAGHKVSIGNNRIGSGGENGAFAVRLGK